MRIVITGANGQLGSDLCCVFKNEDIIPLTHSDVEISDFASVKRVFKKYSPQAVINTAAFHNVQECQKDDLRAFKVNALGAKFLAENCLEFDATLVHISSNYVFDGKKSSPYLEDDLPLPLNVYGITKLTGEYYIRSIMDKYVIVRTSGLYGMHICRAKGGSFIDTMLRLTKEKKEIKVVDDEILTPTYTSDLAEQIRDLIKMGSYGLFHATNKGQCSWYEFAQAIFSILNIEQVVRRAKGGDFGSFVKRPKYSVLDNGRLKSLGINKMRHWRQALERYLNERKRLNLI